MIDSKCATCERDPYEGKEANTSLFALLRLEDGTFRCWRCAADLGQPLRQIADIECDECRHRIENPDDYPRGLCDEHVRLRFQKEHDELFDEVTVLTRLLRQKTRRLNALKADCENSGIYIDE